MNNTDYRTPLEFGTFITPAASSPRRVVDLAVASDRSGLDLVTFQDHPYQPAFLDTWTLMSYVAARTDTVQISGNVHSLPLRPPAVLARAAASLDLLSEGRAMLALGAGAFWDALVAMGVPRLTSGESVSALTEAIAIIRDIWDTDQRSSMHHDGEFYQVTGAKRGPRPAHPIPIVLGAYKPRMLKLVGTTADGWLPSLAYLESLEALTDANARIDDAATAAGREPSSIRRMLNIPPDVAQPAILGSLVLDYGISTFILASDDEGTIKDFGLNVAPAVRDLVAAERGIR